MFFAYRNYIGRRQGGKCLVWSHGMFLQINAHNRGKFRFWFVFLRKWTKPRKPMIDSSPGVLSTTTSTNSSERWNSVHVRLQEKDSENCREMKWLLRWRRRREKVQRFFDWMRKKATKVGHFIDLSKAKKKTNEYSLCRNLLFLCWVGSFYIQLDSLLLLTLSISILPVTFVIRAYI